MNTCVLCTPPPIPPGHDGVKVMIDPTKLCPEHLVVSGIPEFQRTHPNGDCTPTCGCKPLAELFCD